MKFQLGKIQLINNLFARIVGTSHLLNPERKSGRGKKTTARQLGQGAESERETMREREPCERERGGERGQ